MVQVNYEGYMTEAKLDIKQRAKLRANEQRRLEHACSTINELLGRHDLLVYSSDVQAIKSRLEIAIKTQHIANLAYKEHKQQAIPDDF